MAGHTYLHQGAWETRVKVVGQHGHTGPAVFYGKLDEVIESLRSIRASIPEEYRAIAECDINSLGGDDGEYAVTTIEIEYTRPATQEEMDAAVSRSEAYKQQEEQRMRAQYEALKAKFGN